MRVSLFLIFSMALIASAHSAAEPLPQPLTLQHALSLVDEGHPRLAQVAADRQLAAAAEKRVEADKGLDVSVEGRLRWIEPAEIAADQSRDDHKLALLVRKNLYDFGRTAAAGEAARATVSSKRWRYESARRQQRLTVMRAFFDVLLADMATAHAEEAMAVAFITLDRLRNRHELGQISDIELLEEESRYQQVLHRRTEQVARQRATRARLALALNRPGELPSRLARPSLPQLERELPEYEKLLAEALENNAEVRALRAAVTAAVGAVTAARAERRPTLDAELEAAEYARDGGSNDPWRAGLLLRIPLYDGGGVRSAVAEAQARLYRRQAALREAEHEVRQAVLERWLELDTLRVQRQEMLALQDYRDLYLDRSRALYEMEVKADLGDAMVRLTESHLEAAQTDYQIAMVWEHIDALLGRPLDGATRGEGHEARVE